MFWNKLKKENQQLKQQLKQVHCGHHFSGWEFCTSADIIGKNAKRCKTCGKIIKFYYDNVELMKQDIEDWTKKMIIFKEQEREHWDDLRRKYRNI